MRAARAASEDRGAATLLVVTCAGLLLVVGAALGAVSGLLAAHRAAQAAADLAALAGASTSGRGGDACSEAAGVAVANDATLVACSVAGAEVTVEVSVRGPTLLGRDTDLAARARAGPA